MSAVEQLVRLVRRRERLRDVSEALSRIALPAGLLVAAGVLALVRRTGADPRWLWLAAAVVPVAIAWGLRRPRPPRASARAIDECYRLADRIGNAWELRKTPPEAYRDERTAAVAELAVEQAEATARELDPARVVALRVPPLRKLDGLAALALGLAFFVPRAPIPTRTEPASGTIADADESDASAAAAALDLARAEPLRQTLRELTAEGERPAELAQAILDILERLGTGELERNAALEQLEQLELELADLRRRFADELREDPETLADVLRELAVELEDEAGLEPLAEALATRDPKAVDQALEDATTDDAQMRRAIRELERRLARANDDDSRTAAQQREAERRLQRMQREQPRDAEAHERRLQRQRERVEQLRRQHEREQAARDRLERLRRQAARASGQGGANGGQGQRQQAMDRLRQGLRDATRDVRRSSQLRRLNEAIDEAKSFVRRAASQREGGNRRDEQFRRFSRAARGQTGDDGKRGDGKSGDASKTTLIVESEVGQPDMLIEGDGQNGEGSERGEGGAPGFESSRPSPGAGEGSIDPAGGNEPDSARFKDVRVDARRGRGATRAEIIADSSQNGFASEGYRETYHDYRNFAQSALDSEAMPARARRMVRRYYQLIQPRQAPRESSAAAPTAAD